MAPSPEPMLEDLLAEPIIQLVMRRDNIAADKLRQILHEARERRVPEHSRSERDHERQDLPRSAGAAN